MGRNLFDIERPRKVSISIQGYDPVKEVVKSEGRNNNIRLRRSKAEEADQAALKKKAQTTQRIQESELVSLNQSLMVMPKLQDTAIESSLSLDSENWFASGSQLPNAKSGIIQ